MPLPHTKCIINTTPFFFLSIFFSATFSSPFVFFITPLSLFSSTHTLLYILSSFKFQHLFLSLSLSLTLCLHITGSTQYLRFNKVSFVSHSFLLAVRLRLMAHQESRPTSTPPFEASFSSLC